MSESYTDRAVHAVLAAARAEGDFAGWLAHVLARVAGQLGSSDALTAGRPGSWEADLVQQLVKGTVGHADEYLPGPLRKLTDETARQIKEDCRWDGRTQREIAEEYGVTPDTVSDIATEKDMGMAAVNDEVFYGNERGVVLGPYVKGEIQPQLRAVEKLRGGEADHQVYAVPARSLAEAQTRLQRELQREADQEMGE